MSKLVLERTNSSGVKVIEVLTCVPGAEGIVVFQRLKNEPSDTPGDPAGPAGHKVWCWDSIPSGQVIAVDFTNGIVVQSTAALTQTAINAFKANPTTAPEDVLTYAP